jgi:hypothetical protein
MALAAQQHLEIPTSTLSGYWYQVEYDYAVRQTLLGKVDPA